MHLRSAFDHPFEYIRPYGNQRLDISPTIKSNKGLERLTFFNAKRFPIQRRQRVAVFAADILYAGYLKTICAVWV